jgi:hypothetical protein
MGTRNYCAGYIDGNTGKINFWIQCEQAAGVKGTKGYLVDVPKLVFGAEGCRLHDHGHAHHNQHTKSPIPPGAGITTPIQSWKGFSQTFDYHPAT